MSINSSPITTKLASSIPTELDAKSNINWLNVKFHDGTGTTITADGDISSIAIAQGTASSTHQWAAEGWWSASDGASAGDRYFRDESNTTAYETLARMDDIPSGSVLLVADFYCSNKTGGAVEILSSFGSSAANYWQGFKFQTNGDIEFYMTDGAGHNITTDMPNANYSINTRFTVGIHVDILNRTVDSYIDNNATPVDTGDISTLTLLPAPAASSVRGFSLMCNGGGLSAASIFGTTVRDLRVGNFLIVKDSGGALRQNATQIIADMYNCPGDLSERLRNL